MDTTQASLDVSSTFGAILIGSFATCMLYGLTVSQSYFYFTKYPKDSVNVKLLVSVIIFLESMHTGLICYTTYFYFVLHSNNSPSELVNVHWSIPISVLVSNMLKCLVQSYFLHKILILSQWRYSWRILVLFIGIVVYGHFGIAIETTVVVFDLKEFARLPDSKYYSAIPLAITCISSNVMINGALICLLRGHRSGVQRTDNVVKRLILYAVNRCLLISILEIVEITAYTKTTNSLLYLGIDFVVAKLYSNSLLSSLNNRLKIGVDVSGGDGKTTTTEATSVRFAMFNLDDSGFNTSNTIQTDSDKMTRLHVNLRTV